MAQANIFPYLEFKCEQLETDFRKLKSPGSYTSHSAWNVKVCSALVDIFLGWQQTSPSLVADDTSDCTGSISDFWRETHWLIFVQCYHSKNRWVSEHPGVPDSPCKINCNCESNINESLMFPLRKVQPRHTRVSSESVTDPPCCWFCSAIYTHLLLHTL